MRTKKAVEQEKTETARSPWSLSSNDSHRCDVTFLVEKILTSLWLSVLIRNEVYTAIE